MSGKVKFDTNIKARLVYDGSNLKFPQELGTPNANQLLGTTVEQLSEICGRACYDSFGKGRDSAAYHDHLLDVQHWSVYEHAHWTIDLGCFPDQDSFVRSVLALVNRPGMWISQEDFDDKTHLLITINPRHLLDWDRWTQLSSLNDLYSDFLFSKILEASRPIAPQIFKRLTLKDTAELIPDFKPTLVNPTQPGEQWVTLFLSGSRGMSHEQVRHRFCISQRSTRYVDENASDWVQHPVVSAFAQELQANVHIEKPAPDLPSIMKVARENCNTVYINAVEQLQKWLTGRGVDKATARKQARGAARGWLGNALCTELLFSAPINMWAAMLRLRCNVHADAEIRVMYADVLRELQKSQYKAYFENMSLVPSPDGIGEVLKEV